MKTCSPHLLAALALVLGAPVLDAALLVDWGGDYITTSNKAFNNANVASPNTTQYGGFTGGEPDLLSPSSGYSGTSATFYGEVVRNSGAGFFATTSNGVLDNSGTNRLEFKLDNNNFSALLLWKKSDFLNGFNTGSVDLETGSTLELTLTTNVNTAGTGGRAVVRVGSSYYISQVISPASGTAGLVSKELTTLNWFNYDPATPADFNTIGSAVSLASSGTIANVTEAGFYFNISSNPNAVRISSVEFNAVPEPSAYVLFACGLGALLLRRRKLTLS